MGDGLSQGMIYFDADDEPVRQFSVDSRGRATKSTWEAQGSKAIAKTKMTNEYGEATDVGITYTKVNDTTMKVAVHGLENGELSYDPRFEINFKKAKNGGLIARVPDTFSK